MEYKALPFSSVWENGIFNLPTKLVDEYLKLASEYQHDAHLYGGRSQHGTVAQDFRQETKVT